MFLRERNWSSFNKVRELFSSPSENLIKLRKGVKKEKTSFVIIYYQPIEEQISMDQSTHIKFRLWISYNSKIKQTKKNRSLLWCFHYTVVISRPRRSFKPHNEQPHNQQHQHHNLLGDEQSYYSSETSSPVSKSSIISKYSTLVFFMFFIWNLSSEVTMYSFTILLLISFLQSFSLACFKLCEAMMFRIWSFHQRQFLTPFSFTSTTSGSVTCHNEADDSCYAGHDDGDNAGVGSLLKGINLNLILI